MPLRPYIQLMRLDKPIGIRLLFFPAAWAVTLAAKIYLIPYFLLVMMVGATITRAAGCIINDLTDRKLDAGVERTRNRPLAAGTVPVWQAYVLVAVLLLIALAIALSLPRCVFYLALFALPMIAAYPWMKRITWWPQLFLGLTFNLSALFGWVATGAPLTLPAFTLYGACIFWTLGYDTIYAVQDITDDAKIGIRSSARRVGRHLKPFVAACYGLMMLGLAVTGWLVGSGLWYYLGVVAAALHAIWQICRLPVQPEHAGALFRSNQWLGYVLLLALVLDRWL
jgi:4-hydroxybenzoate polyprenyltransferase